PIVCINPLLGIPRLALISHKLIALGFPPLSFIAIVSSGARQLDGTPVIATAFAIHLLTDFEPPLPLNDMKLSNFFFIKSLALFLTNVNEFFAIVPNAPPMPDGALTPIFDRTLSSSFLGFVI